MVQEVPAHAGTAFMAALSARLRAFIEKKVQYDAHWRTLQIIYSGHDVPGEGEHKIAAYIREQLAARPPDAEPQRHCLYGLDADLIMLGLTSHEPSFSLIREEVTFGNPKYAASSQP